MRQLRRPRRDAPIAHPETRAQTSVAPAGHYVSPAELPSHSAATYGRIWICSPRTLTPGLGHALALHQVAGDLRDPREAFCARHVPDLSGRPGACCRASITMHGELCLRYPREEPVAATQVGSAVGERARP